MFLSFKKFLIGLVIFLAVIFVFQIFIFQFQRRSSFLEINFLDIGQGDATLINYLDQYQILVDGGPKGDKLLSQLKEKMPWGDKQIEIVIATHPDADHISGLLDLLKNYQVKLFLDNGQRAETDVYKSLMTEVERRKIDKSAIGEGSEINLGQYLKLKFFNPDNLAIVDDDRNNSSIVFRMDYGESSFLFTGDAEFGSEADMIYDEENLDVDYLKVGHHGSKSSTSENFLQAVLPSYAVISAGQGNRYGHPTEETLNRLEKTKAEIYRTDEKGTIKIQCQNPKENCIIKE